MRKLSDMKTKREEKVMDGQTLWSDRASLLKPSATMQMNELAKKLQTEGRDVLNFTAGEPYQALCDRLVAATAEAALKGWTGYTNTKGRPEFLQAVARKFEHDNWLRFDMSQLISGDGLKSLISAFFAALVNHGDRVLIQRPYWTTFPDLVKYYGGIAEFFDIEPGFSGLKSLLETKPSIKAVVVNNPCNPSGRVLTEDELREMAEILNRHQVYILVDEIYEKLIYDKRRHLSLARFTRPQFTLTGNGVSKAHRMTGYRLGYAGGSADLISQMAKILGQNAGNPSSVAQYVGMVALTDSLAQQAVEEMRLEYQDYAQNLIQPFGQRMKEQLPGFDFAPLEGTFYFWFKLPERFGSDSTGFCQRLINLPQDALALVPGSDFGQPDHVRFTYTAPRERLVEGLRRLEQALKNL
jgi:aspartate aminotransferase